MEDFRLLRLAVLISGTGRTLSNLLVRIREGTLLARILVVVSSKRDVKGLEIAREAGLPMVVVPRKQFASEAEFSRAVKAALAPHPFDLLCMAGWLHKIEIPPEWHRRVLNIHPALLPKFGGKGFYGDRVHAGVLASGDAESGCTVHWVDSEYDHGPIVLQKKVAVMPGDTVAALASRVLAAEFEAYPEVLRSVAEGDVPWAGPRVP